MSFKSPIEFGEVEEAYNGAIDDCIGEIEDAPALDVKPVVHAHWIPEFPNKRTGKAYWHVCSECGKSVYNNRQVSIDEMRYYFCPCCGARMDGKDGEQDG